MPYSTNPLNYPTFYFNLLNPHNTFPIVVEYETRRQATTEKSNLYAWVRALTRQNRPEAIAASQLQFRLLASGGPDDPAKLIIAPRDHAPSPLKAALTLQTAPPTHPSPTPPPPLDRSSTATEAAIASWLGSAETLDTEKKPE